MTINKTASHRFGLAYVAFTTGRMAAGTVVAKHLFKSWMVIRHTPLIQDGPITCQIIMQVIARADDHIRMAPPTDLLRVFTRIANHSCVGTLLLCRLLTSMAICTTIESMCCIGEYLNID
jgi:hypothetical protein